MYLKQVFTFFRVWMEVPWTLLSFTLNPQKQTKIIAAIT